MFRNLQIRSKLVAIVLIPLLAVMAFAAAHAVSSVRTGVEAERLNRATQFAATLTALVDALQRERAISSGFIASERRTSYGTMVTERLVVNSALQSFDKSVRSLDTAGFSAQFRGDLATAKVSLAQLNGFRSQIESQTISPAQVAAGYGAEIETLLDVMGDISEQEGSRSLGKGVDALVAVSRAKEAASQAQGTLFAVLSEGSFGSDDYQRFVTAGGEEQAYLAQFRLAADPSERAYFDQTVTGAEVTAAERMRQAALTARDLPQGIAPMDWFAATTARIDRLHQVELRMGADLAAASDAASSTAARGATIDVVGMALLVGLALGSSLLLARSMAVPLRRLERRVREVAETDLPGVVYRLQHGGGSDLAVIDEHATGEVPVRSSDEIGRLAAAFNSVHRVAVRVAIEQAALRKSIGDMFVNLARRSQSLIDRQLNLIDELERRTEDPEHLADLFRLDHLATRMRRNAENLLVLANTEPGRRWSEPMPIADVLRAASSEVEDFSRVELLSTGDRLRLAGHAGSDVVHLLAELIENAVTFSPPDTRVRLRGQRGASGYMLEIEDSGIGMSDSELAAANERLANPPEIDLALERMLGFFVVGRLAGRHGIEVRLRHSWHGGLVALVVIPGPLMLAEQQPAWSGAASSSHTPLPARTGWTAQKVAVGQPALEPSRRASTTGLMAAIARDAVEFTRGDAEVTPGDFGFTRGDVEVTRSDGEFTRGDGEVTQSDGEFTRGDVEATPGDVEFTPGDTRGNTEVTWGVADPNPDASPSPGTFVDTGWPDPPDRQPGPSDGGADPDADGGADGGVVRDAGAGDAMPSVFDPPPSPDPLPPPPPLPDPPPAAPRGAPPASDHGRGGPQGTTANAGAGAGDLFDDLRTGMLYGRVAGGHRPGRAGLGPQARPPSGPRNHGGPEAS
jgi:HAMP domain-containing protein/anti-sigma regulatory factor (Ser/Thr protein kinase)